jgi:hypothetical protein
VTTDLDQATEFMADTRAELGHWLEICQLQREDIEFFAALVTDSA